MLKNKLIHKASIGKIASNPDKSKHLETATTHYEDMAIDFVHLRSETYNTDSRIPESVVSTFLIDYFINLTNISNSNLVHLGKMLYVEILLLMLYFII